MVTQSNEVERLHHEVERLHLEKETEAVEIYQRKKLNEIECSRQKLSNLFTDIITAKVQLLRKFMAMLSIYNQIKLKYLEKGDRSHI